MTIQTTTLPNGFRIVHGTHAHARICRRLACGWMRARVMSVLSKMASRISWNTWRSRARPGAARCKSQKKSRMWAGISTPYTSREMTAFYARVLRADVALALDVLADIVLNPAF